MAMFRHIFKTKKRKILFLVALLLITFVIFKLKNGGVTKADAVSVRLNTITKYISASGETQVNDSNVVRAQVASTIEEIKFESGAKVSKDDIVVTLDAASLKATSDSEYASYLSAKATLDSSYTDLTSKEADVRAKRVIRDHAQEDYYARRSESNKEALRTAEANFSLAEAKLDLLKKSMNSLETSSGSAWSSYISAFNNLSNTKIKAPATGTLALNNISNGQNVTAGQELFSIVSKDVVTLVVEIDEADISFVNTNQEAQITLDALSSTLNGKVLEIDAKTITTDNGSTAVEAKIQLLGDYPVITGLNGEARIKVSQKENVLTIPIEYVQEDNDGNFVWIPESGKATKRQVQVGISSNEDIEILSGLSENDIVIKADKLLQGQKVTYAH